MDFFKDYFSYCGDGEVPRTFNRWTAISTIGALLGRRVYLPFGHGYIYPNQYIILTGTPGTRKGSAISMGKNLLEAIRYGHITPNKAAKEAFWDWMANHTTEADAEEFDWDIDENPTEAYVAHDEFLDFIGMGDSSFVTNLTNLWDNLAQWDNPKTRGGSILITKPTISILSGITPDGISESFGPLAMGGGFFSRTIFIFAKPNGTKITFPTEPDVDTMLHVADQLKAMHQLEGKVNLTQSVRNIIDEMYKKCPKAADARFEYYMQRRLTHLLKLIMINAASRLSRTPTEEDCVLANTVLYNAELHMPDALGEYGKGKFADITNALLVYINDAAGPVTMKQLWKVVARDLNKFSELSEVLSGLVISEKVQKIETKAGICFIPNNVIKMKWANHLVDFSLLHPDEHNF